MKVKQITQDWIKDQEGALKRAKIIARALEKEMGEKEVDIDTLMDALMSEYGKMPTDRVVKKLASKYTIMVYSIFKDLVRERGM